MCGILGQFETRDRVERPAFLAMLETLASRGPDGGGSRFLAGGALALGHQRLAIIDLSPAGAQPMCNEDGSIWLTFNGEIYNYRDLQKRLLAAGHRFGSDADSEVILHAYEEWGDACVHELRGIFAFGLWDERRRRLFLARDPLGVKPLYYWQSDGTLVFASQPRAILAHPRFRADIDATALQNYLAYRYVPDDQAIFRGVKKLPAGHRLACDAASLRVEGYWHPEYRPVVTRPDEAVELLREKLERAVRSQMVSDVPLGVFLSGGIDSSTVAAIAAAAQPEPLRTFTLGFDAPESDERPYARATNRAIGAAGSEGAMGFDQAVERIPQFVGLYDEPFFDHSGLPTHEVSRLARAHGVKVVLAGDGADELFAGYRWYEGFPGIDEAGWKRLLRPLRGGPGDAVAAFFARTGFLDAQRQRTLLCDAGDFDPLAVYRKFFRPDVPRITALQLLDLRLFLVDDVLLKVDHASMACGVEVRVPFLDVDVVEAAFSIDSRIVFARGERKALLKRAAAHWLPAHILSARKKGFSVPLEQWMQRGLHDIAHELVRDGCLVGRGVFRADGVRSLLAQRKPWQTWLLFAAELWARHWLEREDLSRHRFAGRGGRGR